MTLANALKPALPAPLARLHRTDHPRWERPPGIPSLLPSAVTVFEAYPARNRAKISPGKSLNISRIWRKRHEGGIKEGEANGVRFQARGDRGVHSADARKGAD